MKETLVNVRFREGMQSHYNSKDYVFKSHIDLEVGDLVVVDTQYGLSLGKVFSVSNVRISRSVKASDLKEVVCKCDLSEFNERVEKSKRAKVLKDSMTKKMKELQEIAIFETLSANDESFKEMLEEYKTLVGELQ